eukprot:4436422-Ditylum_brightwellii.AAC.1
MPNRLSDNHYHKASAKNKNEPKIYSCLPVQLTLRRIRRLTYVAYFVEFRKQKWWNSTEKKSM